ncbi:MAG TPA: tRNA dihydrouridine(20/20a) synthase DusA [Thermoanaerobaculia bacterium]|nr:tRNA dihydrouridine(20/20a) synthase DusA [Thermoanaerobaculia bacterium]
MRAEAAPPFLDRRLSVAPMMDCTDRHCRSFHRVLTRRTLLYTEMVTTGALLHGDWRRFLAHEPAERPLALQLGGDDPGALAACAELAESLGFCEVNLNVGCPSDRVQAGRFGACLMRQPEVVAEAVAAMRARARIPVTVKHRLGVDEQEGFEPLAAFVDTVAAAGCDTFVVHARKAWLAGLSPKENREVPPLDYGLVYRLKAERPQLAVVLNGGIGSLAEAEAHLRHVDGVMIGRTAYHEPWLLADADTRIFGAAADPCADRHAAVEAFLPYVERQLAAGQPLPRIARHLVGLFHGEPRARRFRQALTEGARSPGAGVEVIADALAAMAAAAPRAA